MPGAEHTSCTIETASTQKRVDVAVIDEIQVCISKTKRFSQTATTHKLLVVHTEQQNCPWNGDRGQNLSCKWLWIAVAGRRAEGLGVDEGFAGFAS